MKAIERTDEHHILKHAHFMSLTNKSSYKVVFFGDSITRRWEDNIELWNEYFASFTPLNMGVGMDTLENMLWRVQNGQLDGLKPSLIIVLAGTNNITQSPVDYIAQGVISLTKEIQQKCPNSKIVICGLLPRVQDDSGVDCRTKVDEVNAILEPLCKKEGFPYFYYGDQLLAADGSVDRRVQEDGLHLNAEGYKIAGPILKKLIESML